MAAMFAPFATTRSGQVSVALGLVAAVALVAFVAAWRRPSPRALLPILIPGLVLVRWPFAAWQPATRSAASFATSTFCFLS